ncbi:MAG: SIMPL domain-containing protein [Candidatus Kapaibacteriota bacterium]
MKAHVNTLLIALAIIVSTVTLSNAIIKRYSMDNGISVTGLGSRDFVSDLIIWQSSVSARASNLKEAYALIENRKQSVKEYLVMKGVKSNELEISSIDIEKEFQTMYESNGTSYSQFVGYKLTQRIRVESGNVDLVEKISREISELIDQGIEIVTESPLYYYTKLSELKVEMIAQATADAKLRAEKITEKSDSELGSLKHAAMGVFQIIGQNTDEDYESGGSFNTSSKNKTATITVRLEYEAE